MSRRGPAAVAALLALGVGGGFGASLAADRQTVAGGAPTPVAAQSPSIPVEPPESLLPDPGLEPLPTDVSLVRTEMGTGAFRYEFPVPEGWLATPNDSTTTKWHPPDKVSFTYFLRVELVDGDNRTVASTLEQRVADLDAVEQDLAVDEQTADALTYSYTLDRHRRYGMIRWLRPSGSPFAEVEVALTGREVDLPGMEALMARIAAGLRSA